MEVKLSLTAWDYKSTVILFLYSFGAGLLGSLAYMRMLGNTVDSMADGAKGLIKYVID